MRQLFKLSAFLIAATFIMTGSALATKPCQDVNPNGFPSGPHFNLNIIAKKAEFTCPDQEYLCPDGVTLVKDCSECPYSGTCTPIYGGVIFVPQEPGDDDITILMESGKKGPKGNPGATALEVTDWCTKTFDGDAATFRLPKNDEGYAVYARVTGDPKQNPQFDFTNPRLKYVMDENGNDLLLLGFVTTNAYGPDGQLLPRYDSGKKGKGVQKAVNVTPLFMWTGDVCYIEDEDNDYLEYCWVDANDDGVIDVGEIVCSEHNYCCLDADADGDYEHCDPLTDFDSECPADPVDLCCVDTDLEVLGYEYCDLLDEVVDPGTGSCPLYFDYFGEDLDYTGFDNIYYESVTAWCRSYDSLWVFNIADFVGLLFDIDGPPNSGASVIQVRFYPLPLKQ